MKHQNSLHYSSSQSEASHPPQLLLGEVQHAVASLILVKLELETVGSRGSLQQDQNSCSCMHKKGYFAVEAAPSQWSSDLPDPSS